MLGDSGVIDPNPYVVQAQRQDFERVLPASAAMFEEELGFSRSRAARPSTVTASSG